MGKVKPKVSEALLPLELSAGGEGREYGVRLIKAGFVDRRDGKKANWHIPASTIEAAVTAGMFENISAYIDHANWVDAPSVKMLAGIFHSVVYNEVDQSADGVLRIYDARNDLGWLGSLFDQIIANKEDGLIASLGFSIVFYGEHEWREGADGEMMVTTDLGFIESCDVVFTPGADGRLKEMLSTAGVSLPQTISGAKTPDTVGGVTVDKDAIVQNSDGAGGNPPEGAEGAKDAPKEEKNVVSGVVSNETDILSELKAQGDQIAALTAALASKAEPDVVQGMGTPPRDPAPGRVHGMMTGTDQFAPVVDYLFGVEGAPLPDWQFRRADNVYQTLTGDADWRGKFESERVTLGGADSTTLANMATDAMNKVIMGMWGSLRAYRWYEQISAVVPNDGSIQDMKWIGVGGVGPLPTVPEGGTYDELDLADTKEADAFTKYGGYVGITLEMFRKSEIAKIQAVPKGLARAAVQLRSSKIASIFTSNSGVGPTLDQDATALFHADHSNIATTAFGTDSTAWNAVDLAIWSQTEIGSGKKLAISPKFMLCNRALFRAALVVFGYGDGQPTSYVPEAVSRGDDDPRPWPIAVPDFSDANDWAAIVDPRIFPVVMVSYAQGGAGHQPPELFSVTSPTSGLVFTNDKMPVKVRDWFAYGVNGYRGIAKRNVA